LGGEESADLRLQSLRVLLVAVSTAGGSTPTAALRLDRVVDHEEIEFYVDLLARECGRFKYKLSGKGRW
jgi:hypothetical protein